MAGPSSGPFAVRKNEVIAEAQGEPIFASTILDADGNCFAHVLNDDCAGMDAHAAQARAQRIAESLNKTEGHSK
jgi:hypothetical protein